MTDVGYATSNIRIRIGVEEEIIDCDLTGPDIHPPSNPTNPNNLPPWHPLFPELQDEFWEIVVGGATPSPTNQMLINCLNSATQHWIDDIDALNDRLDADELDCYAYNLALPLADLVDLLPSLTEAIKNARATQGGSLAEIDWEKVANAVTDIQEAKVNISDCLMDRHQDFSDRYYQRYALLQSQYNTCYTTHPN